MKTRNTLAWLSDTDHGCWWSMLAKQQLAWQRSISVLSSSVLIRYCMQAKPMKTFKMCRCNKVLSTCFWKMSAYLFDIYRTLTCEMCLTLEKIIAFHINCLIAWMIIWRCHTPHPWVYKTPKYMDSFCQMQIKCTDWLHWSEENSC